MYSIMKFTILLHFFCIAKAQMINRGVDCSSKQIIVDHHNALRKKIADGSISGQPKASNMNQLVWDDQLQRIAQSWADNMTIQHNPNRIDCRFPIGENIYSVTRTRNPKIITWETAIESWFNEYKEYTYRPQLADPKTGHYTQVVWANTLYVGCGKAHFNRGTNLNTQLFVCNYGPAGNFLDQYPYKQGKGCEDLCCTDHCDLKYGFKCSVSTSPTSYALIAAAGGSKC